MNATPYRPLYEVHPIRWAKGWELHITGVGVTQTEQLEDAEMTARDYLCLLLDVPEDSFDVRVLVPTDPPN